MNLNKLMKQAQKMQSEMLQAQEALKDEVVEASAGGGMVSVTVNGQKQLLAVRIDPEVVSKDDVAMLQDLLIAAVNDAHRKVDEALQQQMGGMLGGLGIPGLG